MRIPLNSDSPHPLHKQISTYLQESIENGSILPGTKLPPRRELARNLGVARITVETAYAHLESRGLIQGLTGKGTFVLAIPRKTGRSLPKPSQQASTLWRGGGSFIDLAYGGGDPSLSPSHEFRKVLNSAWTNAPATAAKYLPPTGLMELRKAIQSYCGESGIMLPSSTPIITNGSQHALSLVFQTLASPGDVVMCENPTYAWLLRFLSQRDLHGHPLPSHSASPQEWYDAIQRSQPKFLYLVSDFTNPTGLTLPTETRQAVVSAAQKCGSWIVEDDYCAQLRYEGKTVPSYSALVRHQQTIYISSFSKILMPGLRLGFLTPPPQLFETLALQLELDLICTGSPLQLAMAQYLKEGYYRRHIRRLKTQYKKRRDAFLKTCEKVLPSSSQWTTPQGGLFLCLFLPEGTQVQDVVAHAAEEQIHITSGDAFFLQSPRPMLRMNFAAESQNRSCQALEILGEILRD